MSVEIYIHLTLADLHVHIQGGGGPYCEFIVKECKCSLACVGADIVVVMSIYIYAVYILMMGTFYAITAIHIVLYS